MKEKCCWYCIAATDTMTVNGVREIFCTKKSNWYPCWNYCEYYLNDPNQKETPESHNMALKGL